MGPGGCRESWTISLPSSSPLPQVTPSPSSGSALQPWLPSYAHPTILQQETLPKDPAGVSPPLNPLCSLFCTPVLAQGHPPQALTKPWGGPLAQNRDEGWGGSARGGSEKGGAQALTIVERTVLICKEREKKKKNMDSGTRARMQESWGRIWGWDWGGVSRTHLLGRWHPKQRGLGGGGRKARAEGGAAEPRGPQQRVP